MERIIEDIGSCGPFQVSHVFFVQVARFASVWSVYLMMFGNYDPGWKCLPYGHIQNTSSLANECGDNCTISLANHSNFNLSHPVYKIVTTESGISNYSSENSYGNGSRREVNASSCSALDECQIIEFDPSSSTLVSEFKLICDQAYIPSIIICIQMVGMLLGSYISGQIGEWFGRKVALYLSTSLCSLSSLLAIFAPSWQVYAVFMFFVGASSSGILVTNGVYMMEFLNPRWRGRLSGLPTWNVSLSMFAITIYLLRDWVYVHIATSCVAFAATLGVFWTPESLRWLLIHSKEEKAKKVVQRILKVNNKEVDITDVMDKLVAFDEEENVDKKYTYLDLFRTRYIRTITVKIGTIWILLTLCYYALAFSVKSLAGNFYVNILIASITEIPFALAVAPLTNTIGRRWATISFMILTTIGCFIIVVSYFTASEDLRSQITTYAAFLAKAGLIPCVSVILVMTVELYPTAVRNLGVAFHNMLGKIGAIIAPYLIPTDRHSLGFSYIFIGVASIVILSICFSLPETKDNPLQDNIIPVKSRKPKEINENEL